MTLAVIDLPRRRELRHMLGFHEGDVVATVHGTARVYFLIKVNGRAPDVTYRDPIDGEELIGMHFFADEHSARGWVRADDALRRAAVGTVQ